MFDRRPVAAFYGLLIGLTGAGGQLVLFKALTIGPAYLIFPIIALSPGITVLMATFLLREQLLGLTKIGIVLALIALVFFNISGGSGGADVGPWLILALLITVAWGVQAYYMRKAASVGVNDGTTFGYMALSGLLLVPVALVMMGGLPEGAPWQAPALTFVTQLLNAVGALFLVMALSPWQGLDRGSDDQRPRAGVDRSDLARGVSDAAVRLRRRRHRAGHSRLDAHGLRGREAWRGRRRRTGRRRVENLRRSPRKEQGGQTARTRAVGGGFRNPPLHGMGTRTPGLRISAGRLLRSAGFGL